MLGARLVGRPCRHPAGPQTRTPTPTPTPNRCCCTCCLWRSGTGGRWTGACSGTPASRVRPTCPPLCGRCADSPRRHCRVAAAQSQGLLLTQGWRAVLLARKTALPGRDQPHSSHPLPPTLPSASPAADPQLVAKRPMDLACLMAVRNRLAAAIARQEMPPLTGEVRDSGAAVGWGGKQQASVPASLNAHLCACLRPEAAIPRHLPCRRPVQTRNGSATGAFSRPTARWPGAPSAGQRPAPPMPLCGPAATTAATWTECSRSWQPSTSGRRGTCRRQVRWGGAAQTAKARRQGQWQLASMNAARVLPAFKSTRSAAWNVQLPGTWRLALHALADPREC